MAYILSSSFPSGSCFDSSVTCMTSSQHPHDEIEGCPVPMRRSGWAGSGRLGDEAS